MENYKINNQWISTQVFSEGTNDIILRKQNKMDSIPQNLGIIKEKKHKVLVRELHFLAHKMEASLS